MDDSATIKIVIIEADETTRNDYSFFIGQTQDYQIINAYASFDDAAKMLIVDDPDVILLDIDLPGTNGIEAIPKIRKVLPDVHILILTVYESEKIIFEALSNGASGYLTKNTPVAKIIESVKEVKQGGAPMSVNIARVVINSFRKNHNSPLSKRETQILDLICNGKSRRQIAQELFIDLETVRTHIKNIYVKLDVKTRSAAIETARNKKLI